MVQFFSETSAFLLYSPLVENLLLLYNFSDAYTIIMVTLPSSRLTMQCTCYFPYIFFVIGNRWRSCFATHITHAACQRNLPVAIQQMKYDQWGLFFLWSTYFFHWCCSAWILLVKKSSITDMTLSYEPFSQHSCMCVCEREREMDKYIQVIVRIWKHEGWIGILNFSVCK